jgi:hypothetical protein
MDFEQRPYLLALYRDRTPERVFRKAVQCGISELLIIEALEAAARGLACLYVMPTQAKRDRFVANRVDRALDASAFYRRLLDQARGGANNAALKHLGRGAVAFVGSNAENEFIEFPADLVIVDELDRCNQNHLPLVRDRLAASPHKLAAWASTPTVPGYGIAERYDASDGREWFLRCEGCGHWQTPDFFRHVVRQTDDDAWELLDRDWEPAPHGPDVRLFCTRCGRPLDRLGPGQWVAARPGRPAAGYHISQLFVPTMTIAQLWADWGKAVRNDWERQRFHNSLLGDPHVLEGSGLSTADLLACRRDYALPDRATGCSMGVDVGEWLHVRISDHPRPGVRRAVFIGRVKRIDELDPLLRRYDVRCCVIDARPEARLVRKWQQSHPRGLVWRCVYTEDDERQFRKNHRDGILRAARTVSLDDATEDVRTGRNWLPRNVATLDGGDYVDQMTAPVRVLVTDPRGNQRYVWTKPAADHHRHADNYDKIAAAICRPHRAVKIVTGRTTRTFRAPSARVFRAA